MVDSLSRSMFREQFDQKKKNEVKEEKPPKGARFKLTDGCQTVALKHEFGPLSKGIADNGITHIRVKPACDYTFQIRRVVSEREVGDWGAALFLIDNLMLRHRADFANSARVLELGCGLGVPGLVCASLGADVVLTDRPDKDDRHHNLMELLEENISFNFMGPANHPPGNGTGRAGAVEFEWDEDAAKALVADQGYFDFVICSDCVYQPVYGKSFVQLAACFDILCGPSTRCYITLQRRAEDNVEGFLDLLFNKYRFLTAKQSTEFTAAVGTATIEMYTLRRLTETEQFHVDVQSSATQVGEQDVVDIWRHKSAATKFNRNK